MESCGCLEGGKVSLDSQDKLWSLAITFDGNISIKGTIDDQSVGVTSVKMDEPFSRNTIHNELKLVQPWNDFCRHSYFHLNFSCEAISKEMEKYNTVCDVLNGLCASSSEVLSVSSCIDIMKPKKASGSVNLQTEEVVQGDLISLQGKVENIHSHVCKVGRFMTGDEKYCTCIHVADNNHTVRLHGYLSKNSSLVGIGPGATVTFHRALLTHRHELLLTPATYIEVISISHADMIEESVISPPMSNCLKDVSLSTVSPCLFFHRKHLTDNRTMQFHCRVATVLMLVLDNCPNDFQTPQSIDRSKTPKVKVRLAGFILDDGSSLCCCWADDARAELLLRLQEVAHLDASVNLKLSKDGRSTNLQHTVGSCLEKMLKKHASVIVKNFGIPPDFSCRDVELSSVLGKVLSRLEEKLLKFIILNACWKGTLNVIASVLNPDVLNGFSLEIPQVCNKHMLWINEVFQVDPLEEARRLYGDL